MPTASQRTKPLGLVQREATPGPYDHLIGVLRARHDSAGTQETSVHGTARYIDFLQRWHPRQLAESDVNRFPAHVAVKQPVVVGCVKRTSS
jgi:hypothetical protein